MNHDNFILIGDFMTEKINIGFIGAGANTELRHAPGFASQKNVFLKGVANRSIESGERAANKLGIEKVYSNWWDLIDDEEIDAICIGTWPYMHARLSIAALENKKHVLCEARMSMNSLEAYAMLDASLNNPGLVAQVVPPPHTMKIEQHIIDLITEGYIGDGIGVNARIFQGSTFPNPDTPIHWRNRRDLSGNNIMTMGIWYENLMRWVGNASSVVSVGQTIVKNRLSIEKERMEIQIPDYIDIIYKLYGGGVVNLSMSTVVGNFAPELDIWIFGSSGTLRVYSSDFVNPGKPELCVEGATSSDKAMMQIEIPKNKQSFWRVEEEFINSIRGLETVKRTNFSDAVKYMEFTDAVSESLQTGKSVSLPIL